MSQVNHSEHSIVLIGAGKVGQSLNQLMRSEGYSPLLFGKDSAPDKNNAINQATIVFITSNDHSIKTVCDEISPYLQTNTIVSHCSGALSSEVLNAAKHQGCYTASTHPLNTFPTLKASLELFSNTDHNTFIYSEGEQCALAVLDPLFKQLGFTTIEIDSKAKTHYHAACVFACNYLTALMDASLESAAAANIDPSIFWRSVQPIINTTLHNITKHGTINALSGPIARGDAATVKNHIDALTEQSDSVQQIYTTLGIRALEMASQQGELGRDTLMQLQQILAAQYPNQGE